MKKKPEIIVVLSVLFVSIFLMFYSPYEIMEKKKYQEITDYKYAKAKVLEIIEDTTKDKVKNDVSHMRYQKFKLEILTGPHKGEKYIINHAIEIIDVYYILVKEKDSIIISYTENDKNKIMTISLYEINREKYVYGIILIFFISLIIIAKIKGLKSSLTLFFTAIVIIKILLPMILMGYNPINLTIILCSFIALGTLLIIGGVNKKSFSAIIGTMGGLAISGIIAAIIGNLSRVSGLAGDSARMIKFLHRDLQLDFKGILFSAILIGALGAVMDVGLSIASALNEIVSVKPDISNKNLIKSGMNVGKDIVGSMSNTLILAYVGGALQLLILFLATKTHYIQLINIELISSEIITAVSGSIGLIWSVPLTILAFVLLRNKNKK
ncbi:hypothetical protein OSSY52_08660 [Tepiditoga spiralis]|uniref:YibE/F family protein n=1 Tax=Tepiditoga spiralis TaxID=2108365 RepID=A0A7G1G3U2_9BACT|nr:YibE/F family protein [Tepiditoga spiralis]BBE30725.1 hypothetical protein OSSY52_08660 [Tepiditoga spiralis]